METDVWKNPEKYGYTFKSYYVVWKQNARKVDNIQVNGLNRTM